MKFGVREICDVVLKAKAEMELGKLTLQKGMPVIYFDTLKTSTLEGAATTVYAQGGKGNPRLVAWEGDRTVTFTMEDALISPESFSVLSGAGLIDATAEKPIYVHATQQVAVDKDGKVTLDNMPAFAADHESAEMYVMFMSEGVIDVNIPPIKISVDDTMFSDREGNKPDEFYVVSSDGFGSTLYGAITDTEAKELAKKYYVAVESGDPTKLKDNQVLYVDYYVKAAGGVKQIDIEAGKFGGSYYLEASTLFRDQATGKDHAAEFVIPNCKVQSNFTFTMAPSGDPSTFTFTMDAFPDYTKFDGTKKVIAALQIIEDPKSMGATETTDPNA